MIEAKLTELNYNEILMYLGHKGQEIPPELEKQIRACMEKVCAATQARVIYMRLPVNDGEIDGLDLKGNDIKELLDGCEEAVLMAATTGMGIEQLLVKEKAVNMADAVIIDACASAAIENICDNFEAELRSEVEGEGFFLTDRYSPGYGDLPIETQAGLCRALDTARKIGLTLTPSCIMIPQKSVTAIMGISKKKKQLRKKGCEVCSMFMSCEFRKMDRKCNE